MKFSVSNTGFWKAFMVCVFRSIEQASWQVVRQEKEQTIEKFRAALGRQTNKT